MDAATLTPVVCVFGEISSLRPHHAEALASWRFHDPPRAHLLHALGAKLLEPLDLSLNVIGLDIKMYTARMLNLLNFDVQTRVARLEVAIVGFRHRVRSRLERVSERPGPEPSRTVQICGMAVNDKTGKATLVHATSFVKQRR
jgi:hypothetical protein